MKMRIKGNSLRLRLTQDEVKRLSEGDTIREQTKFANLAVLNYSLEQEDRTDVEPLFENNSIRIVVPTTAVKAWANSEQVNLTEGTLGNAENDLKITIEKDFQCLIVRDGSEDEDTFPNPNATK